MKPSAEDHEAIHANPVWRAQVNLIFGTFLGARNGRREWEQLWGQKTTANRCIVCCIPFFAYDLSLGDEVELDSDFALKCVVGRSGYSTFRVWLGGQPPLHHAEFLEQLRRFPVLCEWSSENLVAINVFQTSDAESLTDFLASMEIAGKLSVEAGQT